jgi:23S rRNA (uracil1939-C5)-methyltransferase
MRRPIPPFETLLTGLGPRGVGIGVGPRGEEVHVRGAPPGARVLVAVTDRKRGVLHGRRVATLAPPPDGVAPRCAVFGTCGGCSLQELPLAAQREHKLAAALRAIGDGIGEGVVAHPIRGTDEPYGYRNKLELSFGPRRWLTDAEQAAGGSAEGAFLGFHAPGRFDRVVDLGRCELGSERMNEVIAVVRSHLAAPGSPPPWDPRRHEGWWRHLLLREHGGSLLVALFTGSDAHEDRVSALRAALGSLATAFRWLVNDEVADVARGRLLASWGPDHLLQPLGDSVFAVGPSTFFQTNTRATEVLYDTVGEAAGRGPRLLDLYCGSGTIGQALRHRFGAVLGIEEHAGAVEDARANAARNGVAAEYHAGRVEDLLDRVGCGPSDVVVVDPPRAGLHPRVAAHLAGVPAGVLVYVACNPGSLRVDGPVLRAGGWRCTDLWAVDLFPQTGHVEVVTRWVR